MPQLGKFSVIFVFIFLAGMIFTVFCYIPLLEEETATKKIEFAKKHTDAGGDSDEDESESDTKNLVSPGLDLQWTLSGNHYLHLSEFHHYFCLMEDMTTPPPRI